ncbi:hypothetical protein [Jannaschia seosinensis]|uniref:hypothetical protein n=1 Tax=Jannaschia seosinensis TaxID=313367 RepID=UPI00163ED186|nr:hypothetical protein [Jannaschia seosinensis]
MNIIQVTHLSLTWPEAIAVWLLRLAGEKQHVIAAKFGINVGRISDVLTEKTHVGSK